MISYGDVEGVDLTFQYETTFYAGECIAPQETLYGQDFGAL